MARPADRVPRGREVLRSRRRLLVLAGIAIVGLTMSLAAQPVEAAPNKSGPPITVRPDEHTGNGIGIIVESPGKPGQPGSRPGSDGSCNAACQEAQRALLCARQAPGALGCGWARLGGTAPTPGQLAQVAFGQLRLPSPSAQMSPAETLPDGRTYTVVNMHTWFWTDPATYRPVSKRVQAGGVWVLVTARPVEMRFDPGNGDRPVSCPGPGRAWRAGVDGQWDRGPGGCSYQYKKSSVNSPGGQVNAEAGILWRVTWVGSTGAGQVTGSLPDLLTTTPARFAVAEGQAVVRQ